MRGTQFAGGLSALLLGLLFAPDISLGASIKGKCPTIGLRCQAKSGRHGEAGPDQLSEVGRLATHLRHPIGFLYGPDVRALAVAADAHRVALPWSF